MNLLETLEREHAVELGKDIPDFAAGDTVRVGYKVTEGTRTRVQAFEGVVISRRGKSARIAEKTNWKPKAGVSGGRNLPTAPAGE
jgi:large subunit ribosomal protein L19